MTPSFEAYNMKLSMQASRTLRIIATFVPAVGMLMVCCGKSAAPDSARGIGAVPSAGSIATEKSPSPARLAVSEEERPENSADATSQLRERVLHFPDDHAIGFIYVRPWGSEERWRARGGAQSDSEGSRSPSLARGDVVIPAQTEVLLNMRESGSLDFSALAALHPEDVQFLHLGGTPFGDQDLARLRGWTSLHSLYLYNTQITDAALIHLKSLTSLQYLDLTGTNITDAALIHLKVLRSLQRLDIDRTNISVAGLVQLHAELINCAIFHNVATPKPTPTPLHQPLS